MAEANTIDGRNAWNMHYELVEELFTDSRARTVLAKSRSKPSEQRSIRLPVRASLAKGFRALGGLSDFHQMTQVDHEGLMRWVAVEEFAGIACAITEPLRGKTLKQIISKSRELGTYLPPDAVAWVGSKLFGALDGLHRGQLGSGVPRAVGNMDAEGILITGTGFPKILDWGLPSQSALPDAGPVSTSPSGVSFDELLVRSFEPNTVDIVVLLLILREALGASPIGLRQGEERECIEEAGRLLRADAPAASEELAAIIGQNLMAVARGAEVRPQLVSDALVSAIDETSSPSGEALLLAVMGTLFPPAPVEPSEGLGRRTEPQSLGVADGSESAVLWREAWDSRTESPFGAAQRLPAVLDRLHGIALGELPSTLKQRFDGASCPDEVTRVRQCLELATVSFVGGDQATTDAFLLRATKEECSTAIAHQWRRIFNSKALSDEVEESHLKSEYERQSTSSGRADVLAQMARVKETARATHETVRQSWKAVLQVRPMDPAALKALDILGMCSSLEGDLAHQRAEDLLHFAEAIADEPKLASWLLVERAYILDSVLGQVEAAWGALRMALSLAPGLGPVRDACVQHAYVHRNGELHVRLLEEEAALEKNIARAARLELDAALIAKYRLGDDGRAIDLLERAAARCPTEPSLDLHVLEELLQLLEKRGNAMEVERVRRQRLSMLTEPQQLAYEYRVLAHAAEKAGDMESATRDAQAALALWPHDPTLFELCDRLLASGNNVEGRLAIWKAEVGRRNESNARAAALMRAAAIAEHGHQKDRAIELTGAALLESPDHGPAVEELARLLHRPVEKEMRDSVRGRVALYLRAAEHEKDVGRRNSYLERAAVLSEELDRDPPTVIALYERILESDPARKTALQGLARIAQRAGRYEVAARAILAEAATLQDPLRGNSELRAARLLASTEPERALRILATIVQRSEGHTEARALEAQIHAAMGRWSDVLQALKAQLSSELQVNKRIEVMLAMANVLEHQLGQPSEALAVVQAAAVLDGSNELVLREQLRLVESLSNHADVPRCLRALADRGCLPEERANWLLRCGEWQEFVLLDDEAAVRSYADALAHTPESLLAKERLGRVLCRRPTLSPEKWLQGDVKTWPLDVLGTRHCLEVAFQGILRGQHRLAMECARTMLATDPNHLPALRILELSARGAGDERALAHTCAQQLNLCASPIVRVGLMWGMAQEQKRGGQDRERLRTLQNILEVVPSDKAALDEVMKWGVAHRKASEAEAMEAVAVAAFGLLELASDDTTKFLCHMTLACVLEKVAGTEAGRSLAALGHYQAAVTLEKASLAGASGAFRLGVIMNHDPAIVAGGEALAELEPDRSRRASIYLAVASTLLRSEDRSLGIGRERKVRAARWVQQALTLSPDEIYVEAPTWVRMLREDGKESVAMEGLRDALGTAKKPEAIVRFAAEISRLAKALPGERLFAIDSLRKAQRVAPHHMPTLAALAEHYMAQGGMRQAIDCLELLAERTTDGPLRRSVLLELVHLYDAHVGSPELAESSLRRAAACNPPEARTLLMLLERLGGPPGPTDIHRRQDYKALLRTHGSVETSADLKVKSLVALAELHGEDGELDNALGALEDALVASPHVLILRRFQALQSLTSEGPGGLTFRLNSIVQRQREQGRANVDCLLQLAKMRGENSDEHEAIMPLLEEAFREAEHRVDVRIVLSKAYEKTGDFEHALSLLRDPFQFGFGEAFGPGQLRAVLQLFERASLATGRSGLSIVVRELRALAGHLDDVEHVALRTRPVSHESLVKRSVLDRDFLIRHWISKQEHVAILDVANALAGTEGKLFPAPTGFPAPSMLDRISGIHRQPVGRVFEHVKVLMAVSGVDLLVTDRVDVPQWVAPGSPCIAVPPKFAGTSEVTQLVHFGRLLAKASLGAAWFDLYNAEECYEVLTATRKTLEATEDADVPRGETPVILEGQTWGSRIRDVLGRRQKKALRAVLAQAAAQTWPSLVEFSTLTLAIERSAWCVAYALSGDLLATIDAVRTVRMGLAQRTDSATEGSLWALVEDPIAGEVIRFAMSERATELREQMTFAGG